MDQDFDRSLTIDSYGSICPGSWQWLAICLPMASLFKHFRVHQVFGANTDVGKTILTTLLVCASGQRGHSIYYLKPVSTGASEDADDLYVLSLSGTFNSKLFAAM